MYFYPVSDEHKLGLTACLFHHLKKQFYCWSLTAPLISCFIVNITPTTQGIIINNFYWEKSKQCLLKVTCVKCFKSQMQHKGCRWILKENSVTTSIKSGVLCICCSKTLCVNAIPSRKEFSNICRKQTVSVHQTGRGHKGTQTTFKIPANHRCNYIPVITPWGQTVQYSEMYLDNLLCC